MRTPRIYHPTPLSAHQQITLSESASRHIGRVLRLREGSPLILFDGNGGEYPATLVRIDKHEVAAETGEHAPSDSESPLRITLVQGISKGDHMDYSIQKAVELGVCRIIPLQTHRSVVHLAGERLQKKLAHWQGVIIHACEQCGRNRLPLLEAPLTLPQLLESGGLDMAVFLDSRADAPLRSVKPAGDHMTLIIGPEGGFDEQERDLMRLHHVQGISLGPRVLRTETAGVAALSIAGALWGDL